MKQICGLCAKRECDSCTVPMVHSTFLYSRTYAVRYTLTECRCHFLSRVLFLSVSKAICTGHHYSRSLCIWDARYCGAGWGGMLLGSGPQRLHCPDAAGFPRLPPLQPEGTQRSHFWSVLLHLGCSKLQGTAHTHVHERAHTHAHTRNWQNFTVEHNRCCIPALRKLGWTDFVQVANFPKVCLKCWKYETILFGPFFFSVVELSFRLKPVKFCHIYTLFKANSLLHLVYYSPK